MYVSMYVYNIYIHTYIYGIYIMNNMNANMNGTAYNICSTIHVAPFLSIYL